LVFIGKLEIDNIYRFYTAEEIGIRELNVAIKEKKVEAIIPLQRTESHRKI